MSETGRAREDTRAASAPGEDVVALSIVIPAYREATKIAGDIRAAYGYLCERRLNGEIIVVDDGSSDGTHEVASALASEVPCLRVLSYSPNRGKGYALRKGMAATRGAFVMFADAGLCVPYECADEGWRQVLQTADVAIGSRVCAGSTILRAQPAYRRLGSRIFWWVIRDTLPLPCAVRDTQCGFKIFRGDIGRRLYADCIIDGFMIDVEMLCRVSTAGYTVVEFPVWWTNDPDTRYAPIKGTLQNALQLCRIWWGVRRRTERDARAKSRWDEVVRAVGAKLKN